VTWFALAYVKEEAIAQNQAQSLPLQRIENGSRKFFDKHLPENNLSLGKTLILKTILLKNRTPEKRILKNRHIEKASLKKTKASPPGAYSRLATEKALLLWARNRL